MNGGEGMTQGGAIRSSAHAHTVFCDGKNTAAEMAEAACARGFVSLGFSEHAPQTLDHAYGMADEEGYRRTVGALRTAYRGRMAVYLGVEQDLYGTARREDYDYMIGSVHYLTRGAEFCAVDGARDKLDCAFREWYHGDGILFAQAYYEQVVRCVQAWRPEIIGHFDLIRKHNGEEGRYVDTTSQDYRRVALAALEKVSGCGALLEINTGGMARGFLKTPYPQRFLLEAWREMGGEVIVGSDAHRAEHVDYGFEAACSLAKAAGYRTLQRLAADPVADGVCFESWEI